MDIIVDFAIWFLALGFTEVVAKPLAKKIVYRSLMKYAPEVLRRIDVELPQTIGTMDGAQFDQYVRGLLEEVSKESWQGKNINPLFEMLDVRVTAQRHSNLRKLQEEKLNPSG